MSVFTTLMQEILLEFSVQLELLSIQGGVVTTTTLFYLKIVVTELIVYKLKHNLQVAKAIGGRLCTNE